MTIGPGAGEVPSWFPPYHNQEEVNVLVNANQGGQQSTIWTFKTPDAVADVLRFYESELDAAEWQVTVNKSEAAGASNGSIEATKADGAQTLNLVISKNGSEPSQAMATYTATGG
jgi:hypothetical protein